MRTIILFLAVFFILSSCDKGCLQNAGDEVKIERQLSEFNKIEIESHPIIHFIQDSVHFVEVESRSNLIEQIETKVENGVLKISDKNTCNLLKGYHDTHLYIHFKELERITSDNSPELLSEDTLFLDKLVIDIKGDLVKWDLKVRAENLYITLHSVIGEMKIAGFCNRIYLYTSGRNHCFFKDLECNFVRVNHTSVGDYYMTAKKSLSIDINNYGNFYCYGNPELRKINLDDYKTGKVYFFDE